MLLVGEELLQRPGEPRMHQEDRLAVRALARLNGRQVFCNDCVEPLLIGKRLIEGWVRHGGTRQFPQAFHCISLLPRLQQIPTETLFHREWRRLRAAVATYA